MRRLILRDVAAGCAGVAIVLAAIGVPGHSSSRTVTSRSMPAPVQQCTKVLPVFLIVGTGSSKTIVGIGSSKTTVSTPAVGPAAPSVAGSVAVDCQLKTRIAAPLPRP